MDTITIDRIAESVEAEFDRLKVARPHLHSRIERAEDILVTHLSCKRAGIITPRVRGGELVAYLVKGGGGAVYVVDPESWRCSCPDAHRRGRGCKHAIACWALWRVSTRPAKLPARSAGRRCAAEPKITRHDASGRLDRGSDDLEHVGEIAARVLAEATGRTAPTTAGPAPLAGSYEERACPRCFGGLTYDGERGEWVACERCEGTGLASVFVYPRRGPGRLSECTGCGGRFQHRELVEVTEDHESLTWFVGDKLCRKGCARSHGVL